MRVPLDFDWPLDVIWKGYCNPYNAPKCSACRGRGDSPAALAASEEWVRHVGPRHRRIFEGETFDVAHSPLAARLPLAEAQVARLIADGCLTHFTHAFDERDEYVPTGHVPSAEEVNAWLRDPATHEDYHERVFVGLRCQDAGAPVRCRACDGHGRLWCSDEYRLIASAWEKIEPPVGDGYQLWETVTEGSPQSPVFATLRALAEWCATGATTFADKRTDADAWERMLREDNVHHREGNFVFM